ncbi:hypothetical protein [Bacteroides finegoldii]|nr:hypothetical protein [Bacteroides finegoldii]
MKGIRIAANVAEIIVASSVIVELVEKYGGKKRKKKMLPLKLIQLT